MPTNSAQEILKFLDKVRTAPSSNGSFLAGLSKIFGYQIRDCE